MQLSINKVAAGVVGLAMVAGLAFAFTATRAHAITLSELVELFIALEVIPEDKADEARAVLDNQDETSTDGATMSCNFTRSLTQGDTGTDVMDLQKLLNLKGFTVSASGAGSPGNETNYYGPATAGAVAAMQEAYASEILTPLGLSAGTGYFGASTRAKANALCADDTPDVPSLPDDDDEDEDMDDEDNEFDGEEGSIDDVTMGSADESTLDENQEGGVLAFDVEIEGDVMIDRIDAYMEVDDSATASDDADDYFERAFLMVDGEEVAELDVDDFDDDYSGNVTDGSTNDEEFRLRFSNLDLVYEDGDEPEFQVGFEMLGNLDSADIDGDWYVALDSIRYKDGQGWTDEEKPSGIEESFGFGEEEVAELSITEANSNPDSSVIKVDEDTDETDDVTVFVFEIEEENGIDVVIEDLRVTITTTGSTADEDKVVDSAALVYDGDVLDSTSVPTGGIVDFENIDLEIDGDDEVTLEVQLTFEGRDEGNNYDNGQVVSVAFISITDAEDENGNDEGEMDIDGTPSGEKHQLLSEGVYAEIISEDKDLVNEDAAGADKATFELVFDVTAFESDFYIPFGAGVTEGTDGILYRVETDSGTEATTTGTTTDGLSNTSGADVDGNFWKVDRDTTETFELTVTYDPASNGTYRAQLDKVFYATSTTASLQSHVAAPSQDFETRTVQITDN